MPASSSRQRRELLLSSWADAVLAGDQPAERDLWTDSPAVAGLGLAGFTVADSPDGVDITWQLPDDAPQTHRLPIAVVDHIGGERLSLGPLPDPADPATRIDPVPLWGLGPCTTVLGQDCGLLVSAAVAEDRWAGRPLSTWVDLTDRAVAAVRDRTGDDVVRVWLQCPFAPQQLLSLGATVNEHAAASTWAMGNGPIHVLLDPLRVGALGDAEVLALLTHEIVHVVTDAPRTALPLWVEEGYAEAVTWADDEAGGWRQAEGLLARVRAHGTDALRVPTDDEFADASTEPYARAWTVCRWLQEASGADDQQRWLRDWYATTTALTSEQVGQWRIWLSEQAEQF